MKQTLTAIEYDLFELVDEKSHNSKAIHKAIMDFALQNLEKLSTPQFSQDPSTMAFINLRSLDSRGQKLEEFLIASVVMQYAEYFHSKNTHFLAYPFEEPTDVLLLEKEPDGTLKEYPLQIKHLFDYKTLKETTTQKIPTLAEISEETLSLEEVTQFIIPTLKEKIDSGVYDKTVLVLYIRTSPSVLKIEELKKLISEVNNDRIESIFVITSIAGLKNKETGEIVPQGEGIHYFVAQISSHSPDKDGIFTAHFD